MSWSAKASFYLKSLFLRKRLDAQLAEEVRTHVEMATEANVAKGMTPEEARYAALREFGNVAGVQERTRDEHGWVWLEQWGKDAGFVVRSLLRAKGFSFAVWLTLVVGVAVATVVFALTSRTLVAPPYPDYDQLYLIGAKDKQNPLSPHRMGVHLQAYQEQTNAFSAFAVVNPAVTNVVIDDEPVLANLLSTSLDCFRLLGVTPVLGRGFLPKEYQAGADNVIVITDLFWRKHFNASPDVLGSQVIIDQQVCTVVGVLAPAQPFPPAFVGDVYRPLVYTVNPATPLAPVLYIIGQLRQGITPELARRQLAGVKLPAMPSWASAYLAGQEVVLTKPTELARPETLWVMLGAAALLYGMACLNAMNLMLVRLIGRRHELGIRFALGGSQARIARLLLMESAVLTLAASGTVVMMARGSFPALFAALTRNEALLHASVWDARIMGSIAVLSVLACGLVVALPVWRLLNAEISPSLKDGGRALGGSRRITQLRALLVVLQAALAVILLVGTGLLVRSLDRLRHVDLGFQSTGRVKVQIAFPRGYELAPEKRLQLFEQLRERLAALPGVKGVAIGQDLLLVGKFWDTAQLKMADGSYQPIAGSFAAENFLAISGLKLKSGRWLSDKRGPMEVVINETLARNRFGGEDPVGKFINLQVSGKVPLPVVGVVQDVKENLRTSAGMRIYMPNWVYPPNVSMLLLRLDQDPGAEFAGLIRKAIYDRDPKLIVYMVTPLNETVDQSLWAERNAFTVMRALSGIALGLAVLGIFSVITFTVDSRTREFGVRLALGATPGNLHRLVLGRGVLTVIAGVVLGSAVSVGMSRFMSSMLFETTPYEPTVYLVVAGILLVATVLACWLPARWAAKVDPMVALRAE